MINPGVEGGLLVVTWFDVERGCEIEVRVCPSGVFDVFEESVMKRCLLVVPCLSSRPLEECSIPIRLRTVFVDAVIPLRMGHVIGSITEQEGAVVEFDPHSIWRRMFPIGFNMWVSRFCCFAAE